MGKLNKNSSTALYQQLIDEIRDMIFQGRLSEGERLMTETELSEEYGISRITVRKAIEYLVEEGLLIKKQGIGKDRIREVWMQITFGMFLDGAEWSRETASLGEVKLGPMKFPDWLESRTGLAGVSVSAPERINEYMQKIRAADPEWCRKSFALDAWSTAKQMLSLRDELFSCGWDGKAAPSNMTEVKPRRMARMQVSRL